MNQHHMSKRQARAQRQKELATNPLYRQDSDQIMSWIDEQLQGASNIAQLRQSVHTIALALGELVAHIAEEVAED